MIDTTKYSNADVTSIYRSVDDVVKSIYDMVKDLSNDGDVTLQIPIMVGYKETQQESCGHVLTNKTPIIETISFTRRKPIDI